MRVEVLYVVRGEDGVDRTRTNSRHIRHRADHIRRDRGVDVKTDFLPLIRVEATGGLGLALWAATYVKEFHMVRKNPPPFEGWATRPTKTLRTSFIQQTQSSLSWKR